MPTRLTGILLVVAALVVAPSAWAQEPTPPPTTPTPTPTPTVTPTPTPTPEEIAEAERKEKLRKRKVVRRVYADFRRDGRIDNCEHSRTALKRTRESITDEFDTDFPDFREAVTAAIKDHDNARCEEEEEPEATATPSPTSTPTPTSTPSPTTTPAPTTPPSTDSGDLDDDSGGAAPPPRNDDKPPPSESDVAPVQPEATPAPVATPPPPTPTQLAVTPSDGDTNLLVPAVLLAAALAGLGLVGASAIAARRSDHFAGWGHSLREASYRATGAWSDFGDWLRLGR